MFELDKLFIALTKLFKQNISFSLGGEVDIYIYFYRNILFCLYKIRPNIVQCLLKMMPSKARLDFFKE